MGLCLSSRKLTISNDYFNIIKISNEVIDRLRNESTTEKGAKKPVPLDEETQIAVDKALAYWKQRIETTKSNQDTITDRLQDQYDKTYQEYEKFIPKNKKRSDSDELKKLKSALIQCYRANPKKSLNCDLQVENFYNWYKDNTKSKAST